MPSYRGAERESGVRLAEREKREGVAASSMQMGAAEVAVYSHAYWLRLLSSPRQLSFSWMIATLLVLAVVLVASCQYVKGAWVSRGRKVPPGSLGLPLGIGETLQFVFCNTCPIGSPPPFFCARLRKYGPVFTTHLLGRPTVVSMDPELNKMLLANEEKLVETKFPRFIRKIVGRMLALTGPPHKRYRELATTILGPTAIQNIHLNLFQTHVLSTLHPWLRMSTLDAQREIRKLIFTYIVKSFASLAVEDPNTELLMRSFLIYFNGYSAMPINLPGTTHNAVLKARKRIMITFIKLVEARRNMVRGEHKDVLEMLLVEKDECGRSFSDQDVAELMFSFVRGGSETTSILLTNIVKFLSENDHVVEELRKEHKLIRKNKMENELLTWDDFKQMQFTEYVIKETLRMATIAHFVTRKAIRDIAFKDIVIPKGWTTLLSFSMVHLSPSYFKNPLEFDPWRWKDGENNMHSTMMAFGGGQRSCLGSNLVKFEASIFIHYLLTSYKWERLMAVGKQHDMVSTLSLPSLKDGLFIRVKPLG